MKYYTLIRHRAFSTNNDERFRNAVQLCGAILTDKQVEVLRINRAIVLAEYSEASEKEESVNYPQGNDTLYPSANESGYFKTLKGSGITEEVFIPNPLTHQLTK